MLWVSENLDPVTLGPSLLVTLASFVTCPFTFRHYLEWRVSYVLTLKKEEASEQCSFTVLPTNHLLKIVLWSKKYPKFGIHVCAVVFEIGMRVWGDWVPCGLGICSRRMAISSFRKFPQMTNWSLGKHFKSSVDICTVGRPISKRQLINKWEWSFYPKLSDVCTFPISPSCTALLPRKANEYISILDHLQLAI